MASFDYTPVTRATAKVLDLWNYLAPPNDGNLPRPTGWEQPGFDDSGWATSATPVVNLGQFGGRLIPMGMYYPDRIGIGADRTGTPDTVEALAPWISPPSDQAGFLVRFQFTRPDPPWQLYLLELFFGNRFNASAGQGTQDMADGGFGGDPAGVFHTVCINGNVVRYWWQIDQYLTTGTNLLAFSTSSGVPPLVGGTVNWNDTQAGWETARFVWWQPDTGGQANAWGTITAGLNDKGVLGLGPGQETTTSLVPVQCSSVLPTNILKIVSNGTTTLFLTDDGYVWSCGDNSTGLLGIGSTDTDPHPIPLPLNIPRFASADPNSPSYVAAFPDLVVGGSVVDIAIGFDCAYARTRDGLLFAWGPNAHGTFGNGSTTPYYFAANCIQNYINGALLAYAATAIGCGDNFGAVGIRASGGVPRILTVGQNDMGQLGQGVTGGADTTRFAAATIDTSAMASSAENPYEIQSLSGGDKKLLVALSGYIQFPSSILVDASSWYFGCGPALDGSLDTTNFAAGVGANKIVNIFGFLRRLGGEHANGVQQCGPLSFYTRGTGFALNAASATGDGVLFGGAGDFDGTIVYGTTVTPTTVKSTSSSTTLNAAKLGNGGPSHNPYASGNSQAAACAIGIDGSSPAAVGLLYTWGYGGFGQMGNGSTTTTNTHAISGNGMSGVIDATFANQVAFAVGTGGTPSILGLSRSHAQIIG